MNQNAEIITQAINGSLNIIEQEREREIIARRFGLSGKKETLEQIGESLSITRERVRQLEKAVLIRLRIAGEENQIPELAAAEKIIIRNLAELGRVARVSALAQKLYDRPTTPEDRAGLSFLGDISAALSLIEESDSFYLSLGIAKYGDAKSYRAESDEIVRLIKSHKTPVTIEDLDKDLNYEHPDHIKALASISKQLATLNDLWGLTTCPEVNPRNIRDKIYVILEANKAPMHFNEIADAIKNSDFKRKNVTTQAIHNELIKDSRFVLIGRGIYALSSWGYKKGTVVDIIRLTLEEANKPLTREEIVKSVLKSRRVKETTILLNLQNKALFEKVGKNKFKLA